MFQYSLVKCVRGHSAKLDKPLREAMIRLYKPLQFVPCFLHQFIKKYIYQFKTISVIIEFKQEPFFFHTLLVKQLLQKHKYCKIKNEFIHISCCSATLTPAGIELLLNHCKHIKKIYLNRMITALDSENNSTSQKKRTEGLYKDSNITGKGVTIAIIDTGVFEHNDLKGRIIKFVDFVQHRQHPYDDNGHGTHCAGVVAGSGQASNGKYKGIAPSSNIIALKVLDRKGIGSLESIIQGLDWCIKYNQDATSSRIDIISLSLGTHALKYHQEHEDPLVKMVEEAWKSGITVVTAAGNDGPDSYTIASPGVSERVLTVGALDTTKTPNTVAEFSSRGPTIYGKQKPDLLAPGVEIISLRSPASHLDRTDKRNKVDRHYSKMSGTSMSTPYCAGVVALLLEENHALTPDQIKHLLINPETKEIFMSENIKIKWPD